MFRVPAQKTPFLGFASLAELVFHASVRHIRKSNHNAIVGLIVNIVQSVILVLIMYALFTLLKMRGSAVRGDFMLYTMTGIFMYMTHTKTLQAVAKSDGPTSSMMKHAPMNTIVSIGAAALATLYLQVLSMAVILFFYHVVFNPITIDQPVGAMAMVLLAWASGIGSGAGGTCDGPRFCDAGRADLFGRHVGPGLWHCGLGLSKGGAGAGRMLHAGTLSVSAPPAASG